jgi:ribosomal protein S18 acetylase RimI-like enzyme
VIRRSRSLAGFAISGAAGDHGYLQRLAVDPTRRRQGIALALVVDALHWMQDLDLGTVLVNTGRSNEAALRLYESVGFERLDDELLIAELRLR